MAFTLFLLACYGTVNIITSGKIFERTRQAFAQLPGRLGYWAGYWIKCPMCMGLPVGVLWALVGLDLGKNSNSIADVMAAGFASSAFCWVMRVVMAHLGEDEL